MIFSKHKFFGIFAIFIHQSFLKDMFPRVRYILCSNISHCHLHTSFDREKKLRYKTYSVLFILLAQAIDFYVSESCRMKAESQNQMQSKNICENFAHNVFVSYMSIPISGTLSTVIMRFKKKIKKIYIKAAFIFTGTDITLQLI